MQNPSTTSTTSIKSFIDENGSIKFVTYYESTPRECFESYINGGRICWCIDCVGLENFAMSQQPQCYRDFADEDITAKDTQWDDKQKNRRPHEKSKSNPSRRTQRHTARTNKGSLRDRTHGRDFTVV